MFLQTHNVVAGGQPGSARANPTRATGPVRCGGACMHACVSGCAGMHVLLCCQQFGVTFGSESDSLSLTVADVDVEMALVVQQHAGRAVQLPTYGHSCSKHPTQQMHGASASVRSGKMWCKQQAYRATCIEWLVAGGTSLALLE